ncbi:hypothetical protein CRG98_005894 [Punica granatum]|uniref:Inhibitor I9 domain-containing protein n=1 Tax=Punica granatum TaxID=22663 RepID=A0A2I0KZ77_PUNGR|nr:hypothetical protein CRG98_005894 [Punica granatum]
MDALFTFVDRKMSSISPSASTLYTYSAACHGFATSLAPDEADSLRMLDSVLGVYEDTLYTLHTTQTPEFLGISNELGLWSWSGFPSSPNKEYSDVIIGVLDTGVWPESSSFDDSGMPSSGQVEG